MSVPGGRDGQRREGEGRRGRTSPSLGREGTQTGAKDAGREDGPTGPTPRGETSEGGESDRTWRVQEENMRTRDHPPTIVSRVKSRVLEFLVFTCRGRRRETGSGDRGGTRNRESPGDGAPTWRQPSHRGHPPDER